MGKWPSCKSQYKGACKKCKAAYESGALIHKINEDYWCPNENCPGSPGEKPKPSVDLEAKLDQMWDICHTKTSKIIDETYSTQELPDKYERKKQKLIVAQAFVKALCGHGD